MKFIVVAILLIFPFVILGQQNNNEIAQVDTIYAGNVLEGYTYQDPVTKNEIRWLTWKVREVYPYAKHAADVLEELEAETNDINKRWKVKRKAKEVNDELEENFKFALREMTRSEGRVLMTLVHYMTGYTVYEIMEKYRGKIKAEFWYQTAKIWDQDLKIEFNEEKDWMLGIVLERVENGRVKVADNPEVMTKEDYKELKQERKERKKERKRKQKAKEKARKEFEREKRKAERKNQ